MFRRTRLTVEESTQILSNAVGELHKFNSTAKVIFTVSPIRHISDGLHGNQVSKSTLHLSVEAICAGMPDIVQYFPAYEIMMDDLRDYRFYTSDMCHPSDMAINYIYEIFSQTYFAADTISLAEKCRKYTMRLKHRPMTDDAVAIAQFNQATEDYGKQLIRSYPYLSSIINNE